MVGGSHVAGKDGGYLVRIAVRDASQVIGVVPLAAPAAAAEPDALEGLRVRVRDVLHDKDITRLALWHYEGSPGGVSINAARPVVRAEGVLLAAAGELGVDVIELSASSERRRGGHRKNDHLMDALASTLGGTWPAAAVRAVAASTFA